MKYQKLNDFNRISIYHFKMNSDRIGIDGRSKSAFENQRPEDVSGTTLGSIICNKLKDECYAGRTTRRI